MDEQGLKVLAIFCLLFIALIFGLTPLYCVWRYQDGNQSDRFQLCFSIMNAFAGGVFLSIALLHLLPDVRELLMTAFAENGRAYTYAWAELITAIGFFFIAFLEQGVELCLDKIGDQDYETLAGSSQSQISHSTDIALYQSDSQTTEKDKSIDGADLNIPSDLSESNNSKDILRACVLLFSLSVHSVFEGLSLGLQQTIEGTLDLFLAIAIHKGIEALGVAINVAQSQIKNATKVICMIFFALMSPLGILIGLKIVSSESASHDMVTAVLQGLATGTFLYITFLEILPLELKSKTHRLPKLLAVSVGFVTIAVILLIDM